jgi:hypothetical protein
MLLCQLREAPISREDQVIGLAVSGEILVP